jgi:two-component system KDP operon response regulator KdpE
MTNVLIVDDDALIRRFLRAGFELHGYTVLEAKDARGGLKAARSNAIDLIILDLELPDLEGSEVLERIRSWSNIPVIIHSIRADEGEKVRMFNLGADDYVVKPCGISELLARSDAALRPQQRSINHQTVVKAGPLAIDLASRLVTLNAQRVQLTRKEYELLRELALHVGLAVSHDQLIARIWGGNSTVQILRMLVRKLRQKIENDPTRPFLIVSKSGVGYRLDPEWRLRDA